MYGETPFGMFAFAVSADLNDVITTQIRNLLQLAQYGQFSFAGGAFIAPPQVGLRVGAGIRVAQQA